MKDRVGSYFLPSPALRASSPTSGRGGYGSRPIEMFISEVKDLEIRKTDTVLEAYILEQELIKKFQPKYNVDGKDDKSFCYVLLTKEGFPRFLVVRKTDLNLNQKSNIKNKNYNSKLKNLKFSKIYGPYIARHQIETALKILRKIFPYHAKPQKTEKGCLDYQIGLCPGPYDGAVSKENYRKNIRGIQMILEGKKKSLLNKMKKEMEVYSEKHEFEKAAEMRNKIFALQHIQDVAMIRDSVPNMETKSPAVRIEGYDISNISGKWATGSMVVFDNLEGYIKPNKSQYRKFKIKTIEDANDVGAMKEILVRRFGNNWPRPNLIILDGGRGHLNMAKKVLRNFHLEIPIIAVAKGPTRKKLDVYPHTYNKKIEIEGVKNMKNNISGYQSHKSVGMGVYSFGTVPEISKNTIEKVRDEAHRFAIKYHRKLRGIKMIN